MKKHARYISLAACLLLFAGAHAQNGSGGATAFVGARIIDGTGKPAIENGTLMVRNGRITAVGASMALPPGIERIDVTGQTIIPGLINGHGHVNSLDQLGIYARDGVTTVMSLGGDHELELRDQTRGQQQTPALKRARLLIAGPIVVSKTPEDARQAVDALAAAKTDIVKFRIDDNLGAGTKMTPAVYTAIIDEAKKKGMRVAVHAVNLSDVKAVLRLGVDLIAHSVRDVDVDDETIALFKRDHACYCPTLTRELSTYVYAEKPAFLDDPFFLKEANPDELAKLRDPKFQEAMRHDKAGQWYKEHLAVALRNLKKLADSGVPIMMGTDSGVIYRFQGYFEHLELETMARAGLTPMQILTSATGAAARCLKMDGQIGTLQAGRWADLVVLNANPLDDIRNTRKIASVWIAGNRVPGR